MTIAELRDLAAETERVATPHRLADWDAIGEPDDARVKGQLLFIEEHNTGYDGILERWQFSVNGKRFMIDLLPGRVQ